ncbi:MAG: arsenate reductase (glutaredoxin) [Candidatus Pelagadaptatus aseana]
MNVFTIAALSKSNTKALLIIMFTIYHNPRCSKSRQTLALLEENNIEPEIVLYLETTPDADTIKTLLGKLGIGARELLRKGEEAYKQNNLKDTGLSEQQLVDAMVAHPKLIERPIVVKGDQAVLGRPPENVLALID